MDTFDKIKDFRGNIFEQNHMYNAYFEKSLLLQKYDVQPCDFVKLRVCI